MMMVSAVMAFLLASPQVQPLDVTLVGPRHLLVAVPSDKSPDAVPEQWSFLGPEDDNYSTVQHPEAVTLREVPTGADGDAGPAKRMFALLFLPSRLQDGVRYQLGFTRDEDSEFRRAWRHNPETRWTPSIQLNQVGYLPEALSKYAYLSYWTDGLDPIEVEAKPQFRVFRTRKAQVEFQKPPMMVCCPTIRSLYSQGLSRRGLLAMPIPMRRVSRDG